MVESESPLGISKECIYNRDKVFKSLFYRLILPTPLFIKREGIDLVHDNVEQQLNQEVDVIRSCQEKMKRLIARAEQQLQFSPIVNHLIHQPLN